MNAIPEDTIIAQSTPHAGAPVAVVRLSGPEAVDIYRTIAPDVPELKNFRAYETTLTLPGMAVPVDATVYAMLSPTSYTTEDVIELHVPGAPAVADAVTRALRSAGARDATPGEFTRRALVNGRIDLSQAEAVSRLIRAADKREFRTASLHLRGHFSREVMELADAVLLVLSRLELGIDFAEQHIELAPPEELAERLKEVRERIDRLLPEAGRAPASADGARCLIAGRSNVGKSSLFNALTGKDLAITHGEPGTTRDYLTCSIEIHGSRVILVDTAGLRDSEGEPERLAIRESRRQMELADVVIYVVDSTTGMVEEEIETFERIESGKILVRNKTDLTAREPHDGLDAAQVSCKTGKGIDDLKCSIGDLLGSGKVALSGGSTALNARHSHALKQADDRLKAALKGLKTGLSEEFTAIEVREALGALRGITGEAVADDVLETIFSDFCVGK